MNDCESRLQLFIKVTIAKSMHIIPSYNLGASTRDPGNAASVARFPCERMKELRAITASKSSNLES